MNIDEVAKRLPLHKFEVLGLANDQWLVRVYVCGNPNDAGRRSQSWVEIVRVSYGSIEEAMERVLGIYLHGIPDDDQPQIICLEPSSENIWTSITLREYCRGRDSGSEWSDPENDIIKSGSLDVHVHLDRPHDRHVEWHGGFSPCYPLYAIASSYKAYVRLCEHNFPTKKDIQEIVGFEWRDMVFNNPHVIPEQTAVCGGLISKETDKNEMEDGGDEMDDSGRYRPKIDYFEDHVVWHKRGEIIIVGSTFYLNGKAILTVDEIMAVFPDANRYSITGNGFYQCEEVLDWIKNQFPEATSLLQSSGGCSWINFGNQHIATSQ